jgi:tetratricopeptide (TPR) repeat protein
MIAYLWAFTGGVLAFKAVRGLFSPWQELVDLNPPPPMSPQWVWQHLAEHARGGAALSTVGAVRCLRAPGWTLSLGAIGNFAEAIRLIPMTRNPTIFNIRCNVWDELGIYERALTDYDEAIRIDPNNPAVLHDRAILCQRRGALDKALVDLDTAVRFSFADANIYCDGGLVWYEKGHHDRAIADFNRAIKLDPNFAATYINRGLELLRGASGSVRQWFRGSFRLATSPPSPRALRMPGRHEYGVMSSELFARFKETSWRCAYVEPQLQYLTNNWRGVGGVGFETSYRTSSRTG